VTSVLAYLENKKRDRLYGKVPDPAERAGEAVETADMTDEENKTFRYTY
jgi:hypothetical protein